MMNTTYYKYLIIGGGMASYAAVNGIRNIDQINSIGIINEDEFAFYKRPWLSKKLWQNKSLDEAWLKTNKITEFFNNTRVVKIMPQEKKIKDNMNNIFTYEKLLIASGGHPKKLPDVKDNENIIYFRNLNDYFRLKNLAVEGKKIAIIGGSFIGSEIAAVLTMKKCDITMIFPENGICAGLFPDDLSVYLNNYYQQKGVKIINKDEVVQLNKTENNHFMILTKNNRMIEVDAVVIGIGIKPNTDFLKNTNIKIDINGGIQVNEYLMTSDPFIYAAGDVTSFYYPQLGKNMRFEHEDNALSMGEIAGNNMANDNKLKYNHLPFFYSDLFEFGYEAVGELNHDYEIIEKWDKEYQKGRLYYLNDNIIKGILLWNVWDEVDKARELISQKYNDI